MRIPIEADDSASKKAFRITRWALARGGKFTPKELIQHFGLNRSTAYRYSKEWRDIFGDHAPPRARLPSKAQREREAAQAKGALNNQTEHPRFTIGELLDP